MTSLAVDTFPNEVRGTGSALSVMMNDLGLVAGAPILGQVVAVYGYNAIFVAVRPKSLQNSRPTSYPPLLPLR